MPRAVLLSSTLDQIEEVRFGKCKLMNLLDNFKNA